MDANTVEITQYSNVDAERRVLSHRLRFERFALSPDLITIPEGRTLLRIAERIQLEPINSFEDLWCILSSPLRIRCTEEEQIVYKNFLASLFTEAPILSETELNVLLEELDAYRIARKMYNTLTNVLLAFKNREVIKARDMLLESVNALSESASPAIERINYNLSEHVDKYVDKELIPTFIPEIDAIIGGVASTSLNLIQGETGIGKTFFLCELAYRYAKHGYNVMFVSVELREVEIAIRLDARYHKIPIQQLRTMTKEERKALKIDLQGNIGISFIPEGFTMSVLQAEYDYWKRRWRPDVVIIDYADLLTTNRKYYSEQELQGNIFRDLKRFSQQNHIVVWTATQVSLKSFAKSKLGIEDISYSARKACWSNLILGLAVSEDEPNMLNVTVLKNTYSKRSNAVIQLPINYEYASVGE